MTASVNQNKAQNTCEQALEESALPDARNDLELVNEQQTRVDKDKPKEHYFQCSTCILKEKYEYFGKSPPFAKDYKLEEDAYVTEDPFLPPRRGEFIVLGAHCVKCRKVVCKDSSCSFYFGGTYCIQCAKEIRRQFPQPVQEKLNRIVMP